MKYYYLKREYGIFKYHQNGETKYGYRLHYYDKSKRRDVSHRGYATASKAIHARDAVHTSSHSSLTIARACDILLQVIKPLRKISTYKSYQHLLNENIIPLIGNYSIKQLHLSLYQADCINVLISRGLSRRTIIATNARLQTVINYMVRDGRLKHNPIADVTIPDVNNRPPREIMNNEQLEVFNHNLQKQPLRYQTVYFTLELTGIRCGELLGLHWKDIDLTKRIMHIKYTRDEYGLRQPKTSHSRRSFFISKRLDNLLKRYHSYCIRQYNVSEDSLVILGRHGKPLTPNIVPIVLKRLLRESNLNSLVNVFVPHSFRHTFASRMISHNVDPITVSEILGHANPDITMKMYAQYAPNQIPDIDKLGK